MPDRNLLGGDGSISYNRFGLPALAFRDGWQPGKRGGRLEINAQTEKFLQMPHNGYSRSRPEMHYAGDGGERISTPAPSLRGVRQRELTTGKDSYQGLR